ncbi:hypothetical protein QMK17_03700 [Rhodococcus sp. G-MC3]|uniref:phthiocerol/phthiodiolone dimycocerosyl transferase family protein n=1 Tax=Rhodococcus sp. G-MC3 TaxID=3046209 RepID=UPI0024BB6D70|nr:hypothetical protein [Rhodococcus sp. G-MC3]MDJ0392437.1 hypothetical protein [Rhodococcus sp. G-MC3]
MTKTIANDSLRPLGAFERTIDLYMHRNPVQFSIVLNVVGTISEDRLEIALRHLQTVHPLLAAGIQQPVAGVEPSPPSTFSYSSRPIPIRIAANSTWEIEAAQEQTMPIETGPGPLVRATLIPALDTESASTIILTFAHQITDGRGALRAAQDLAAILDDAVLPEGNVPPAQEDRLLNFTAADAPASSEPPFDAAAGEHRHVDPLPPGRLRAFDASVPVLQISELSAETTRALGDRSRAEFCTVQAALCAAAASTLFESGERTHVRINVPIDLRSAVDANDDVAICFGAAMIHLERTPSATFWVLARDAAEQLERARQPHTLRAGALGLAAIAPTTADDAETLMLTATTADIEITNLGVTAPTHQNIETLWGPTMTTQVENEQILGVITHDGVLRMVNTTHNPIEGLIEGIHANIVDACTC